MLEGSRVVEKLLFAIAAALSVGLIAPWFGPNYGPFVAGIAGIIILLWALNAYISGKKA